MKIFFLFLSLMLFPMKGPCQNVDEGNPPLKPFNNVNLEMSLKPFKKNERTYIETVCRKTFEQWKPLLHHADTVSVMLWTADGSEILDYSGDLNQRLEWGMYIGNPNTEHEVNAGPEELSIHERAYTYLPDPPELTYGDLRYIVQTLKTEGRRITGKPVRVGATFDPGPEFAKSPFKYKKHPEICMGNTMGSKSFVCCYAVLNEDKEHYAGYPEGIPQGTPFGAFFGKQSQAFLSELGFDFLWLSNGFGFGMETWSATGAIFDGKSFHTGKTMDIREKITMFWQLFRASCPDFRIETRGTNLSVGIDLAGDGVDLRGIYDGGFNLLPPPNSPWAALDGDFGLELTGYMSRIAELPDNRFLFRYYTHDPWWSNSPWLDRYGRESHDIYLPMAVARIDKTGETRSPSHLSFLSIDDSYGNMPDQVPEEVIPHILQGRRISPDRPGMLVWVYPFDEYHDWFFIQPEKAGEIYYGDWFIRQAMNDGFPMNTVVSTRNFSSLMQQGYTGFDESVLVTVVPEAGSEVEKQLINFVHHGGNIIVYGPAGHASKTFLDFMNIRLTDALSGDFILSPLDGFDKTYKAFPSVMRHDKIMSGGGIETVVADKKDPATKVLVKARQGNAVRDIVVMREQKQTKPENQKSKVIYVRGTNSASLRGGRLLTPDNPEQFFTGGALMRYSLSCMGYTIRYEKQTLDQRNPVNVISRCDNGFYFAGYVPVQTVEQQFRFPQGAPIFTGMETELKNGFATYRLPKSWSKECRVFVEQKDGIVSCFEIPRRYQTARRLQLNGLSNATVRFYYSQAIPFEKLKVHLNENYPFKKGQISGKTIHDAQGNYCEFKNITGQLVFSW